LARVGEKAYATKHGHDRDVISCAQEPEREGTRVARDGAVGEAIEVGIGDDDLLTHASGESSEAGATYDGYPGLSEARWEAGMDGLEGAAEPGL
jgi:hypothetical protein